jgi:hypothetical protein
MVSRTCQKRPDFWLNQAADLAAKRHPRGNPHSGLGPPENGLSGDRQMCTPEMGAGAGDEHLGAERLSPRYCRPFDRIGQAGDIRSRH